MNENFNSWDDIILPKSVYLVMGDVGTGKSVLSFWIVERYSAKYNLTPCVVGFPQDKKKLIPSNFEIIDEVNQIASYENSIIFVDEAGMQLPLDDIKVREKVTNVLQIHRQRRQLLLLGYHYPRLILARYLPFLGGFLLKRPPYLKEFASKSKNDSLAQMMNKAEDEFSRMIPHSWKPTPDELQPPEVKRHTYVVSPQMRWQGLLKNPTPTFWSNELSEVWSGINIKNEADNVIAFQSHDLNSLDSLPHTLSTEERMLKYGLTPSEFSAALDMDYQHSGAELIKICRDLGLPTGGEKKKLIANLIIARRCTNEEPG